MVTADDQAKLTPASVLADLKAGNERFVSEQMINRDYDVQVEGTADGQFPKALPAHLTASPRKDASCPRLRSSPARS